MGIFNKMKQAFGFGGAELEYDEDSGYDVDATVTPLRRDPVEAPRQVAEECVAAEPASDNTEEVPVDAIFSTVVRIFNESLPSFLKESVDTAEQQKHLYQALDKDVRDYMARVAENAKRACGREWEAERLRLNRELAEMRDKMRDTKDGAAEKDRRLLSAERQRRAINERVHDLETQISKLEAEREQFELENRSLVNKMRVMNVMGDGADGADMDSIAARMDQIEKENGELKGRIEEISSERDALAGQVKNLTDEAESLRLKSDMSDTMFTDLNERASAALKESAEKDERIKTISDELASARDHETDLKTKLKDALAEADILRNDLDEARANLEIAARIQGDVERIQEVIEKKNTQISDLNTELRRRDDRINALEIEEKSLRRTIDNNIRAQAESEAALRDRIAELEKQASGQKTRARRGKSATPKISAIDEDLDNTDWLVATPPEGTTVKTSGVTDSEFGYQEPVRKTPPPENSAQMSLW